MYPKDDSIRHFLFAVRDAADDRLAQTKLNSKLAIILDAVCFFDVFE